MQGFGYSLFDSDKDGSVGDQMAEKRLDPLAGLRQRRPHTVEHNQLPAKPKTGVKLPGKMPTHADVHGHLDNAKKAGSDSEKRQHVFKALTALNRRQKLNPQSLPGDSGAT